MSFEFYEIAQFRLRDGLCIPMTRTHGLGPSCAEFIDSVHLLYEYVCGLAILASWNVHMIPRYFESAELAEND